MYSVVIDGMGRQLSDNGAWGEMQKQAIPSEDLLGPRLFRPETISPSQQSSLWTDPDYGL